LAPFFAYYSLVSSADSQIKTKKQKHQNLAPKFVIFLFVYIFSVFFSRQKKFRQKLACAQLSAKMQQLNDKQILFVNRNNKIQKRKK